jgi:hypothetical protein
MALKIGRGFGVLLPNSMLTYHAGDGVSLYGPVGPSGSPYSVQLDGGSITHYNPNKQFYTPQVELYRADNLGPGSHSLKLLYQPVSSGQVFAIDHANVYTTPSISGYVAFSTIENYIQSSVQIELCLVEGSE